MAYKNSKQRELILNYMKQMHGHISAEDLFHKINENEKISLATIYRNLGILVELEEIKKIALEDGYVYDKTCTPHYHFYCDECKTLYDLEHTELIDLHDQVANEHIIGDIYSHEITFKGTCRNCKIKKH